MKNNTSAKKATKTKSIKDFFTPKPKKKAAEIQQQEPIVLDVDENDENKEQSAVPSEASSIQDNLTGTTPKRPRPKTPGTEALHALNSETGQPDEQMESVDNNNTTTTNNNNIDEGQNQQEQFQFANGNTSLFSEPPTLNEFEQLRSSPFKTPVPVSLPGKRKQPFTSDLGEDEGRPFGIELGSELGHSDNKEVADNSEKLSKEAKEESGEEKVTSQKKKRVKTEQEKKQPATPVSKPLAVLKSGRLMVNEKKLNLDGHPETVSKLGKFFQYVQEADAETFASIAEFPAEYYPLLALLVQDCDVIKSTLAKRIQSKLFPLTDEISKKKRFSLTVIENAIDSIGERINYGPSETPQGSFWRWEINAADELFPPLLYDSIQNRRLIRENTRECLRTQFEQLSEEEKELFKALKHDKEAIQRVKQLEKEQKDREKEELRLKKEREKEERVLAKQKEKEEAQKLKQQQLSELKKKRSEEEKAEITHSTPLPASKNQPKILNFFSRKRKESETQGTLPEIVVIQSDFEQTFKQFHPREGMKVAPSSTGRIFEWNFRHPYPGNRRAKLLKGMLLGTVSLEAINAVRNRTVKLLQFQENYRPAYYGTWNRASLLVCGRKPFASDEKVFDYEYESDLEWEEGDDEGEECLTEEEDDDEEDGGQDQMELDDDEEGWLVPHGYLSEGEGIDEDDVAASERSGDKATAASKRLEPLIPVVEGPFWDENIPESVQKYCIRMLPQFSTIESLDPFEALTAGSGSPFATPSGRKKTAVMITDEQLGQLAELVDKSTKGVDKLVEEFRSKTGDSIPKVTIAQKIKEIAVKEKREGDTKSCWHLCASDNQTQLGGQQ